MNTLTSVSTLLAMGALGLGTAHAQNVASGATDRLNSDPSEAPLIVTADKGRVTPAATGDDAKNAVRDFITKSLRTGEDLVDLSDLAAHRAVHPPVRTFAEELTVAHTNGNKELAGIIERKGLRVSDRDMIAAREMTKQWNAKSGNEIDGDYLNATIDHHEGLIDLLEDGVDSNDTEVAVYSRKHLPAMKSHVERAKALLESID